MHSHATRTLVEDLFFSEQRKAVDAEIQRLLVSYASNGELRNNILYHFNIGNDLTPSLEHSKRLRSFLCLLFGNEGGFSQEKILPLAVFVELIHNSTLIIDDIQDGDDMRCGRDSLWKKIGIAKAVHAGYYLSNIGIAYYNDFRQKCAYANYNEKILETLDGLFSGQQLDLSSDRNLKFENYQKLAHGKTGALILLASMLGAMPYEFDEQKYKALKRFAFAFSEFYQVRDDYADVTNKNGKLDSSNIVNFMDSGQVPHLLGELERNVLNAAADLSEVKITRTSKLLDTLNLLRAQA